MTALSISKEGISQTYLHKIVQLGISHVPEGRKIFPDPDSP
jgi:ABC-type branched-subunit amino acid transport system ATPase component